MFFHANGEDLGTSHAFAKALNKFLKVNVLAVEYPGYGLYKASRSSEQMLSDAEFVFDWLCEQLPIAPQDVFVVGQSIGTGPALHVAAGRQPGLLVLVSAFTSLKDVLEEKFAGKLLGKVIKDRFPNRSNVEMVGCPTLFVHGQADALVPFGHTLRLFERCRCVSMLHVAKNMGHAKMNF